MTKYIFASMLILMAAFATLAGLKLSSPSGERCISVIYDNAKVLSGMRSSLAHFPEFQSHMIPMADYEAGTIERCQATFIVNTEFDNQVPRRLVEDYLAAEKHVVWMGYNIWYLGEQLNKKLGLRYIGSLSKVRNQSCAYFYMGRSVRCDEEGLSMQPEIVPTNEVRIEIMAESRTRGRELSPYVVRAKNHFYMADVNFGNVFQALLTEFVGSPMRVKTLKPQQVAGPN
ncbi:hypothetical protein [Bdellovibrio sp. KM01]|uniref:hypothetical protein n=1 Tax=Bdellovibrio sp. KM01 TaxID=2748865 RepID=UPI001C67B355|nr:hypothetical protein [Bdellovibrio sp. KM01]